MRSSSVWIVIVLIALVLGTVGGAISAYYGVRQMAMDANELVDLPQIPDLIFNQPPRTAVPVGVTPTIMPENTPEMPAATSESAPTVIAATATSTPVPQFDLDAPVDPNRRTVLLLGIDQRQGEQGPFRTDTIIVLSLDPVRQDGVMLSIPRDLWVSMPGGFEPNRINTANFMGDSAEYPGGGPALAAAVIEQNLGIRIDDTVRVNFDLFLTVADAVGPVEVCIEEDIYDDHYPDGSYGIMTVEFQPGCQDLDSERLLQYARTRATEGGDFDRAARQQQVIQAIKDSVLSLGGVQAMLGQVATLWESVRENIQTTLTLEEIIQLANWAQDIPAENIRQAVLDVNYVQFRTTASGDQVLHLRPGAALSLVQELFNPLQLSEADLRQLASGEAPTISVVNGTAIAGLAAEMAEWLEGQGFTVSHVGNAAQPDHRQTLIKDLDNLNPYTTRLLAALLGIPTVNIQPGLDTSMPNIAVQIVVGEDVVLLLRGEP